MHINVCMYVYMYILRICISISPFVIQKKYDVRMHAACGEHSTFNIQHSFVLTRLCVTQKENIVYQVCIIRVLHACRKRLTANIHSYPAMSLVVRPAARIGAAVGVVPLSLPMPETVEPRPAVGLSVRIGKSALMGGLWIVDCGFIDSMIH